MPHFLATLDDLKEQCGPHTNLSLESMLGAGQVGVRSRNTSQVAGHVANFEVTGADRPGIVAEVAGVLAKNNLNIERMETLVRPVADGSSIFEIRGHVQSQRDVDRGSLSKAIKHLEEGQDVKVAITFMEK